MAAMTLLSFISYRLTSEISFEYRCTAVQVKSYLKNTSVIKVVTIKITDNFCYKRKPLHASTKSTLFAVSKDKWNTKEYTVSPCRMHCTHCGMPKSTSRTEAMSNSEKSSLYPYNYASRKFHYKAFELI